MAIDNITYYAEIKSIKQTKSASLDNVYSTLFVTDNADVMDLGKYPPDTLVEITVRVPEMP